MINDGLRTRFWRVDTLYSVENTTDGVVLHRRESRYSNIVVCSYRNGKKYICYSIINNWPIGGDCRCLETKYFQWTPPPPPAGRHDQFDSSTNNLTRGGCKKKKQVSSSLNQYRTDAVRCTQQQ